LKGTRVCIFSAGTGEVTQTGSSLFEFQTADADGDGIEDLFAFEPDEETSLDAGGTLVCFRGQSRQLWRSIGRQWLPTADLDLDGTRDLIRTGVSSEIAAASGSDGRLLWSTRLPTENLHRLKVVSASPRSHGLLEAVCMADDLSAHEMRGEPSASECRPLGDFDSDGVIDLLAYLNNVGLGKPLTPLYALSGRTGRRLWSAEITGFHFAGALALDTRDLDGDGRAEVLWVGASDWDFPDAREFSVHQKQIVLAVLSGSDGRLVWKHPLSRRYGLTPQTNTSALDFQNGWLALSYADLNGDGALEVLAAAEAEVDGATELRAISGRTGEVLWRHSLPPGLDSMRPFSDVPPASLADLDGDGRLEVVVFSVSRSPQTGRANAVVEALEGTDGRQRWSAQWDVSNFCGRMLGDVRKLRYQPRPLPLRVADGTSRICLNLWDSPERIIVLDSAGQTVSDFRLQTQRGFHRGQFRVWPCDADADGNDEILLTNRDHLMAIPPDRPDQPLWQRPIHHLWSEEIEGILPADEHHEQRAVMRHVDSPGTVYALDTATGRTLWTAASPSPRREGHYVIFEPSQAAMLRDATTNHAPRLFFQHALVSSVYEASPATTAIRDDVPAGQQDRAARLAARLPEEIIDPRLQRPLPWVPPVRERTRFPQVLAWGVFFGVAIFYVPGIYAWRSFNRRRWNLKWFLLLPAAVALPLIALVTYMPDWSDNHLQVRMALGAIALPALLAFVQLARWSFRRRWRPVAAWLATAALSSLVLAALALAINHTQTPLLSDEYYAWDNWWFVLLYGAYAAACLQMLLLLGIAGVRWLAPAAGRWQQARAGT
jgi:outer membrane protein assembly factor BamB